MSNGFQVDLDAMSSLITTLVDAKDAMTSADNALKDASAEDLGSAGLDSAGAAFRDRWKYGIGKIAGLARDMADGLQQTRTAYLDSDSQVAAMFSEAAEEAAAGASGEAAGSEISRRLSGGSW